MTPQGDGAKYTSLLFTPRTTDSAKGLPDYRWGPIETCLPCWSATTQV